MRQTTASTMKRPAVKTSATQNRIEKPLSQTKNLSDDFRQKVEEVAYQLFEARGGAHGYDVEDWLAAEEIVRGS